MKQLSVGDLVGRLSYGCDICFRIYHIYYHAGVPMAVLYGVNTRLIASAPLEDLELMDGTEREDEYSTRGSGTRGISGEKRSWGARENYNYFNRNGLILHLDGDAQFLERCLDFYRRNNLEAIGEWVKEEDQPFEVERLLKLHNPELLVITGHDGLKKDEDPLNIANYQSSAFFVQATQVARRLRPGLDDLVIFAGACQSYFEALINAGANFASSPERILINDLVPAQLVHSINATGVAEIVDLEKVISQLPHGVKGVGGIETRGKLRKGYPAIKV